MSDDRDHDIALGRLQASLDTVTQLHEQRLGRVEADVARVNDKATALHGRIDGELRRSAEIHERMREEWRAALDKAVGEVNAKLDMLMEFKGRVAGVGLLAVALTSVVASVIGAFTMRMLGG